MAIALKFNAAFFLNLSILWLIHSHEIPHKVERGHVELADCLALIACDFKFVILVLASFKEYTSHTNFMVAGHS